MPPGWHSARLLDSNRRAMATAPEKPASAYAAAARSAVP